MLTKLNNEVGIDPKCKKDHNPDDANLFTNNHSQRYFEWRCGCTAVYSAMSRPGKAKAKGRFAKGVGSSSFVKGLFKSDFF